MLILISICSSFHVRFCLIHDGFKIVIPHHVRALVSASVRNLRNIIRIDAYKSLSANYMFYHLYKSRCISEWYNSMLPFFYQDVEFKSINRFISTLITLIYKSFYCNVKVSLVLLSCSRNFVRWHNSILDKHIYFEHLNAYDKVSVLLNYFAFR